MNVPDDLTNPDKNGVLHPPDMVIHWAGYPTACCHLYRYSNGVMPNEVDRDDDVDYLHICDPNDFIQDIQDWVNTTKYIGENK